MLPRYLPLLALLLSITVIGCDSDNKQTIANPSLHFEAFDIMGQSHSSAKWIGKQPVVLNFWGTWCGPCRKEVPDLVRLYEEYSPRGVEMISLAIKDTPDKVDAFARHYGMKWIMLLASRDIILKFGVTRGVPTTIFLDRDGHEVMRFVGARPYETLKTGFEAIVVN